MSIWQRIVGGWKTWGPGAIPGDGGFASSDNLYDQAVNQETAMKLSAVFACQHLRAETIGTMPFHLRDAAKNIITDHPVYSLLHDSPNADQTAAEFWSLSTAHEDMHGNFLALIDRRKDGTPIALSPLDPTLGFGEAERKSGMRQYRVGSEIYPADRILHFRGFSMNGLWGLPRLHIGREILSAQLSANDAALKAFKQGLKVGGFFITEGTNLDVEQKKDFGERLSFFGRPENAGKYMLVPKGLKPLGGKDFRVSPMESELLQSRYFGIEEICRLYNTPPQLIGHTDKASSWASSLETLDLFFLTYSVLPTLIRREQRVAKQLLSPLDRAKGIVPKFAVDALGRTDLKTRTMFYASGLQNGYLNRNEVRDLEERGTIPGGDEYTIQLNMQSADNTGGDPTAGGKKP